jgi:hypothetical protein
VLDTANPRVPLLEAMIRISDAVPKLRIVLDHLPSLDPAEAERGAYDAAVQELGKRPQIFVKLSAIIHRVNGQVSTELGAYRARLDRLMRGLRRRPHPLRQRLAQQRRRGTGRQGLCDCEGVLPGAAAARRGEVLLEELDGRLQVDQARCIAAGG